MYDLDDIHSMPAILMSCIRAGTWSTPNAPKLRILSRMVRNAHAIGIDELPALVMLAGHARNDIPVPHAHLTPEMKVIERRLWSFLSSPIGLRHSIDRSYGPSTTIDEAIDVVRRWLRDERAKAFMPAAEADDIIRAEVGRLAVLHPDLGLSYGYIGNCDLSGSRFDDRSFMVFTTLRSGHGPCPDIHFGGVPHADLGALAFTVSRNLEPWVREQQDRLDRGEIHRIAAAA